MVSIYPNKPILLLLALWSALGLLCIALPALVEAWLLAGVAYYIIALFDAWRSYRQPPLTITRTEKVSVALNHPASLTVTLSNPNKRTLRGRFDDILPAHTRLTAPLDEFTIDGGQELQLSYQFTVSKRGDYVIDACHISLLSPWRLWRHKHRVVCETKLQVMPRFTDILQYNLFAKDNRLTELGIKRQQQLGSGTDFAELREFQVGDSMRHIHWKSSSRHNKPISKKFQEETDQQIIFLLDTSRRMRHKDKDGTLLDQAMNAMLMLGYVAGRQGDACGFMTFGSRDNRWLPPLKGHQAIKQMLHKLYNVQCSLDAVDYQRGAMDLLSRVSKRSLIVVLSNSRNEDHEELATALRLLGQRHLVVFTDIRETVIDRIRDTPVHDMESALAYHSALRYQQKRKDHQHLLTRRGILVVDKPAHEITSQLINQYIALKRKASI